MADCTATTKAGKPCSNRAMAGRDVCKQHSGDPDVGRKSLLTEDTLHRVTALVRNGNYFEVAVRAAGISVSTAYRWMETGEADDEHGVDSLHREFWQACTRARAEAEAQGLQIIEAAARQGDWKAAAWRLERMYPTRYGRQVETKVSGSLGTSTRTEAPAVPSDEDRLREVAGILGTIGALPS